MQPAMVGRDVQRFHLRSAALADRRGPRVGAGARKSSETIAPRVSLKTAAGHLLGAFRCPRVPRQPEFPDREAGQSEGLQVPLELQLAEQR